MAFPRWPHSRQANALRNPGRRFLIEDLRGHLLRGQVIPAHPLALTAARKLDERHQRALTRYYLASGAGGIAVGVHTTQFEIRDRNHGLYEPVLSLAVATVKEAPAAHAQPFAMVAGVIGSTRQAVSEAETAKKLGYDAALLSLGALASVSERELIEHCRHVGDVIPLFGFYLQPAVGGRRLSYSFWREFVDLPAVIAIKIAPFDRYETLAVVRAVAESGRTDVALYTGNDDNIIADLVTRYPITGARAPRTIRMVGGLLGHWAVWTSIAADYHRQTLDTDARPDVVSALLALGQIITEMNAAVFDPLNGFRGCIPGINDVLRRQGLMQGAWCLDPSHTLSPGQREEIDRVIARYPDLVDDAFVLEHLDDWLR